MEKYDFIEIENQNTIILIQNHNINIKSII